MTTQRTRQVRQGPQPADAPTCLLLSAMGWWMEATTAMRQRVLEQATETRVIARPPGYRQVSARQSGVSQSLRERRMHTRSWTTAALTVRATPSEPPFVVGRLHTTKPPSPPTAAVAAACRDVRNVGEIDPSFS